MKETRNVNLHGAVLTIDDDAYQLLKEYLADIESRLPADERKDVMDDLESRVAELLQAAMFAQKAQSATIEMVRNVRARIGEPSEFGENKRPTIKREPITRQGVGRVLTIVLKVILIVIAIQLLFPVLAALFGLLMAFFGLSIGGIALVPALGFELMGGSTAWTWVLCLSVIAAVAMPIYMIVHWIVKWSRERKHPSLRFWIISLLVWLLSLGGLVASAVKVLEGNGTDIVSVLQTLDEWDDEDGAMLSEAREVEPFHAVEISGAVKADIYAGEPQEVSVRFDRQGGIETEVRDGVLIVRGEGNHSGKAVVHVPTLDGITLSGASKADVHGVADSLHAEVSGASKLDAEELIVRDLHINVNGASKAEVYVTGTLWAQASGASTIRYEGNPQVLQSLAVGASTIRQD
ncbi:MAG: DUF2807 domain-containing protein [Paludibacteraceae bacterium]|nr:DUF2807 domain-containing protein [Paludibacteraceae bacterium]MBQ9295825.1 DUF2807 domain-containing protein [Paludibacteraceae bacterium]